MLKHASYYLDVPAMIGIWPAESRSPPIGQAPPTSALAINCVQAVLLLLNAGGAIAPPSDKVYVKTVPGDLIEPHKLLFVTPSVHFLRPVLLDTRIPDLGHFVQRPQLYAD